MKPLVIALVILCIFLRWGRLQVFEVWVNQILRHSSGADGIPNRHDEIIFRGDPFAQLSVQCPDVVRVAVVFQRRGDTSCFLGDCN